MQSVELIVTLLAIIGIVGALAERIKIALPILLVLAGMGISLLPGVPDIKLEPDIVFFIFLPPLLYLDAYNTSWKELKIVGEAVIIQAVGLVLATVAFVGMAIHMVVPDMPWSVAFTLGAIVSPTDAVAAYAITRFVNLPKRMMEVIKGESLLNDATGLVSYQFAVAATVTGGFSFWQAFSRLSYVGVGGALIGLAVGWYLARIRYKLDHRPVEIIVSLLSPYVAYILAEHLHVSGIIVVVTAGIFLGWHGPRMLSSQTRLHSTANWETISYILNGFCFLLMGMQLESILEKLKTYPQAHLLIWVTTAILAPFVVRFVWTVLIVRFYLKARNMSGPTVRSIFVFSWAGMRGVVSLAAALALPLTTSSGAPFPHRDLLIFLTVCVIASSLLVQGLTLPAVARKMGIGADDEADARAEDERKMRLSMAKEAVRRVDQVARLKEIDLDNPAVQKVLDHHLEQAAYHAELAGASKETGQLARELALEAIKAQRKYLIDMREKHEIAEEVFKLLQKDLDFEETRLLPTELSE